MGLYFERLRKICACLSCDRSYDEVFLIELKVQIATFLGRGLGAGISARAVHERSEVRWVVVNRGLPRRATRRRLLVRSRRTFWGHRLVFDCKETE